jgi:uncharacterized protein involved in type VI secretion and phage assembly
MVLDTRDPTRKGRVRLRIPAVSGDTPTGWAFVAGAAPKEGDTVVVAFEEGDVRSPIVLGVLWSDDDAPT